MFDSLNGFTCAIEHPAILTDNNGGGNIFSFFIILYGIANTQYAYLWRITQHLIFAFSYKSDNLIVNVSLKGRMFNKSYIDLSWNSCNLCL